MVWQTATVTDRSRLIRKRDLAMVMREIGEKEGEYAILFMNYIDVKLKWY